MSVVSVVVLVCVGYLENIHRVGNSIVVLHCVDLTQAGQSVIVTRPSH